MSPVSDKGNLMLEDLHPQFAESPTVRAVMDAVARELQRVEDTTQAVREAILPYQASDTYGTLKMWELMLGLPVAPAGVTLQTRQSLVAAGVHKRRAASGADWSALISQALGSVAWTQTESGYTVTVLIPQASGFVPGQVAALLRRITPAHLQITTGYTGGFIIGVSNIGDNI